MKLYPALVARPVRTDSAFSDLVAAALDGSGVSALEEMGDGSIRAFFADALERDRAAEHIGQSLPAHVVTLDVSDEDWAARSQASVSAIRVGQLAVAPPWDVPANGDAVIILPSTGFGTGHHATTRLCLAALQDIKVAGKSVLDVGTGSGVLAIASVLLGAERALGIDYDQDAIDNALENLALNAHVIDGSAIDIRRASIEDADAVGAGAYDVVLANLTGATLIRFAGGLKRACAHGGALIVSGLREEEESDVTRALACRVESRSSEGGWLAFVLRP